MDQIFIDLIKLLTIKHDDFIMLEPENQYLPCWIDSEGESKEAFEEAIQLIMQWCREMTDRICTLRQKTPLTWVRGSGNLYTHKHF